MTGEMIQLRKNAAKHLRRVLEQASFDGTPRRWGKSHVEIDGKLFTIQQRIGFKRSPTKDGFKTKIILEDGWEGESV